MYSCQDTSLEEFHTLFDRYDMDPVLSLEVPTLFYSFKQGDQLLGYGKLTVKEGRVFLEDFVVEADQEAQVFFLKALGYKVYQLGYETFQDPQGYGQVFGLATEEVALEDLFRGMQDV